MLRSSSLFSLVATVVLSISMNSCVTGDDSSGDVANETQELDVKNEPDLKDFHVDDKTGQISFAVEVVYFEYDSYTLAPEALEQLGALSDFLKKNPGKELAIEGHCDNRGSNEYNLALGDSRAFAVKRFLTDTGVDAQRLKTVSFGEEKPAAEGNGEPVWAKNRRGEFTLTDNDPAIAQK
jgi:peptidoglycan-associated lipoprotein